MGVEKRATEEVCFYKSQGDKGYNCSLTEGSMLKMPVIHSTQYKGGVTRCSGIQYIQHPFCPFVVCSERGLLLLPRLTGRLTGRFVVFHNTVITIREVEVPCAVCGFWTRIELKIRVTTTLLRTSDHHDCAEFLSVAVSFRRVAVGTPLVRERQIGRQANQRKRDAHGCASKTTKIYHARRRPRRGRPPGPASSGHFVSCVAADAGRSALDHLVR